MNSDNPFFDQHEMPTITVGNLPHINQWQKLYAVTFRLNDSLPKVVVQAYIDECRNEYGDNIPDFKHKREEMLHKKMMECLDAGYGECLLRNAKVRKVMDDAFHYIHDNMAKVHAYVVMPNHVHAVIETKECVNIQAVMHNLKGYTASKINKLLMREGGVWQRDYYDRLIRNEEHYENAINYILHNPRNCKNGEYSLGGAVIGSVGFPVIGK